MPPRDATCWSRGRIQGELSPRRLGAWYRVLDRQKSAKMAPHEVARLGAALDAAHKLCAAAREAQPKR
jgi:hypothetical protein